MAIPIECQQHNISESLTWEQQGQVHIPQKERGLGLNGDSKFILINQLQTSSHQL